MHDILDIEVALAHPLPDMPGWNDAAFLKDPMDGRYDLIRRKGLWSLSPCH
jgi:hypothetical protein